MPYYHLHANTCTGNRHFFEHQFKQLSNTSSNLYSNACYIFVVFVKIPNKTFLDSYHIWLKMFLDLFLLQGGRSARDRGGVRVAGAAQRTSQPQLAPSSGRGWRPGIHYRRPRTPQWDCPTNTQVSICRKFKILPMAGLEPMTYWFRATGGADS